MLLKFLYTKKKKKISVHLIITNFICQIMCFSMTPDSEALCVKTFDLGEREGENNWILGHCSERVNFDR